MQIYEDLDVTICVFILKRGVRLPLHDHPGMCGLLKVGVGVRLLDGYREFTWPFVSLHPGLLPPQHPPPSAERREE